MQNSMLNTTDILVNRTPVVVEIFSKRQLVVVSVGVTQIVPGGAQEGVHGISFTGCIRSALGALAMNKAFRSRKRRFGTCSKAYVLRQTYRQILLRHQHLAAMRAVDDGNRSAPVTLTADEPVAQAEVYAALAEAFLLSLIHNSTHSGMHFHTGKFAGVNQHAFLFLVSAGHFLQLQLFAHRANGNDLVNAIFISKHPVTLVARRNAHNSACTIIIQNVVGNPDFHLAAGEGVNAIYAGEDAFLFRFAGGTLDFGLVAYTLAEGFDFFGLGIVFANSLNQRMLSSQCHKGYAIGGIRTGGINSNLIAQRGDFKAEFQTLAAADPVALHGLYALRPAL